MLNTFYFSPTIRFIESRMIRWAGHVACIEKMRNLYNISITKYGLESIRFGIGISDNELHN